MTPADRVAANAMNVFNNPAASAARIDAVAANANKVLQGGSGSTSIFGGSGTDFLDTAGDYLFRGGQSVDDIATEAAKLKSAYVADALKYNVPATAAGLADAAANAQPNLIQQFGPTLALGGAGAYALGAFDQEEQIDPTREDLAGFVPQETGYDLFQADPSKYRVADLNPYRYDTGNPVVTTRYVADGGYMENTDFPRREMLVEGLGTERSDDIPAMLSDGEFVYNAKAVRGADPTGQGDRYKGAKNLYNMMRNFEMRA
jgi:Ca2+-binding RTX toxin-like protein